MDKGERRRRKELKKQYLEQHGPRPKQVDVGSGGPLLTGSGNTYLEQHGPRPKQRPRRKMGFIMWAFSGGVYLGRIRGSIAGSCGVASLAADFNVVWNAMASSGDPESKSRLLVLLILLWLLGVGLLALGYYQYSRSEGR